MSQYQRREDLTGIPDLLGLAAKEGRAFMAFHHSMEREDGIIPRKYRELIAVGVAVAVQCPFCMEAHAKGAKAAGATREEIVEATFVASAIRAGAATTHGTMALKFFDQSADGPAKA